MMFIIITRPERRNQGQEEALDSIIPTTSPKLTFRKVNQRQKALTKMSAQIKAILFIGGPGDLILPGERKQRG
jgi:hypothetical protein